jgi:hypothetical protein
VSKELKQKERSKRQQQQLLVPSATAVAKHGQ